MKSIVKIALGIVLGCILLFGGCAAIIAGMSGGDGDDDKNAAERATEDREAAAGDTGSTKTEKSEKPEPSFTAGQEQAIAKAEMYLDTQAFSKSGLVKQLKFEKFPEADAVFAVNHIKVNWREQAAAKAEQYLDTQAFSRDALIDQLKFEGFTDAEAAYGVKQAGL
jgi:hypothetical protein